MNNGTTGYTRSEELQHAFECSSYLCGDSEGSISYSDSSYVLYSVSRVHISSPMMEEPEHVRVSNSILESVKEQEAQFERLTQELEAERRSVVDQLEQVWMIIFDYIG